MHHVLVFSMKTHNRICLSEEHNIVIQINLGQKLNTTQTFKIESKVALSQMRFLKAKSVNLVDNFYNLLKSLF